MYFKNMHNYVSKQTQINIMVKIQRGSKTIQIYYCSLTSEDKNKKSEFRKKKTFLRF